MEKIESAGNRKIKLAASLSQRKHREREGLFLAEGVRLCEMAAASGWQMEYGLVTESCLASERGRALCRQLEEICPLYLVSEQLYRKAASVETPQGLLLVIRHEKSRLADLPAAGSPLYVVLDGVQDPGNAGTIIRTADAAGAAAVILMQGTTDIFADKAVRATMGSLFHLPVCSDVTAEELAGFAAAQGARLCVTALDERAKPYFACDLRGPVLLVFGNEGSGVSAALLQQGEKLYIPMQGSAESLNVGVAAAIVLYEAVRQRHYAQKM